MRYHNVCLESFGHVLPDEVLTSAELEQRLSPLYERLRLPEGRLELMTGIRERRLWAPGTLPSEKSIVSGRRALEAASIDPAKIGALVHGSVCRDFLEPATASGVHYGLGLAPECIIYDVSNACLGMLNGLAQVANMIELGQIEAGLVVGTEGSRQLVETTVDWLNRNEQLTRDDVKLAIASLTIGSASAAMLLVSDDLSRTGNRLVAITARANTEEHRLCHSGRDEAASDMKPLMFTDSERLLHQGVALGRETFERFVAETGWSRDQIDRTFCHQVGVAHRKLMLDQLGLAADRDFMTVDYLGNTGAAACPASVSIALEQGRLPDNTRLAMLGIGSGINCLMVGVDWRHAPAPL